MSDSPLSVVLLVKELRQVTDWHMLGLYLEIPPHELKIIRQQFLSEGVERCKAELFDLWLKRNPSASWDDVASALEQAGEAVLANNIRKIILSSDSASLLPTESATGGDPTPQARLTLELNKSAVKKFTDLEGNFAGLVSDVKNALEEKAVPPKRLHDFLEARLGQDEIKFCSTTSIADLFKCISPYYCFLNITLLENIINKFIEEPELKRQLDEYEHQLDDFTSSTEIALLQMVHSKCQPIPEGVPLVILKLAGRCLNVTIKRFQKLVNYIFEGRSTALSNIHVKDGCICITWTTRKSAIPSLVALAQEKVEFMRLVGVLRLSVGETIILEQTREKEREEENDLALMRAVTAGCTAAVEFLLSAGANPNCRGEDGLTPLIVASMKGSQTMVKALLEGNVDPNLPDNHNLTPLMWACSRGHEPIVNLLLQSEADPNIQTVSGRTALLCVSYTDRHLGIVRSLLAAGAAVDTQNGKGWSALMNGCYHGCSEIVKLLLQYNADVQLSTSSGLTALMLTCENGSVDIVEQLLLVSSANVNAQTSSEKFSALMLACENGHEQIAALLLNSQADPNLQDHLGYTALMLASQLQFALTVELLLDSGADPNLRSESGCTPLMCSCAIEASPDPDHSIPVLLLSAGADPNAYDGVDNTALMHAASSGYEFSVKVLLNAEADVNAQDMSGNTALHLSTASGHLTITELLLSSGADASLVNHTGDTAVDIALSSHYHEVRKLLLMHTETKPRPKKKRIC